MTEPVHVSVERWGSLPLTYVCCAEDRVVPPPLQRLFITQMDAVAQTPVSTVEFASSHSPMLSRPIELADAILATR